MRKMTLERAVLLCCAFALAGCSPGDGGPSKLDLPASETVGADATADLARSLVDIPTDSPIAMEVAGEDSQPDAGWDSYCPYLPPPCEIGQIKCKFNNTAYAECLGNPDPDWADVDCQWTVWGEGVYCNDDSHCQTDVGCVCDFGSCDPEEGSTTSCGSDVVLPGFLAWQCADGCCSPMYGCETGSDCQDCVNMQTGEQLQPCPQPIPEGFVDNKCTQDECIPGTGQCGFIDKTSLCDDGDPCTNDDCDPISGDCVYLSVGPCPQPVPCWGAAQPEADALCDDADLCTVDSCWFEDGFNPWDEGSVPDPVANAEHIGQCQHVSILETGGCDDSNPCTLDDCDPQTGCFYVDDIGSESTYCCDCAMHADCDDGNPCTAEQCDQYLCCVYTPDDNLPCDDGDPETTDVCQDGVCVGTQS